MFKARPESRVKSSKQAERQTKQGRRTYLRDGRAPIPERQVVSETMSAIRAKDTKPELSLRKALRDAGLSGYRTHWCKAPGKPDIAFPGKKIAVFVHGCYWHRCPHCKLGTPRTHKDFWQAKFENNVSRDKRKSEALRHDGWAVLIIWECEIKADIHSAVATIKGLYVNSLL